MHVQAIFTFLLAFTLGIGSARAQNLTREIHTTFQPLLWNGHQNKVQITAEGAIRITEGKFDLPTLLGDNALRALEAAARRLHQRYGGRRAITVEAFGDTLDVRIGGSTRSTRQGSHFLSVYGTGGDLRHISHTQKGPARIERSRSVNAATGAQQRRVSTTDGRARIKLLGPNGAFGIVITQRGGMSGGQIQVPAAGSSKPALRIRPDGTSREMPANRARQLYRWIGPRHAARSR